MKRLRSRILKKRNRRRLMACAFLILAMIEIGSHAFANSDDPTHFQSLGFCGINHAPPLAVDVPARQKQRGPSSNLLDKMVIHAIILNDISSPRCGVSYWKSEYVESITRPLAGSPSTPFHPPKLV
jgi:hypothetical protein